MGGNSRRATSSSRENGPDALLRGKRNARRNLAAMKAITPTGFAAPVNRALPEAVRRIVDVLHPEKIIVFGSFAHGEPTPDSDVDLLVIIDTDAPPAERHLMVSRLLRPRPFPVDIMVRTPAEIESALNSGDTFIGGIISEGKTLYERGQ